MAGATTTAAIIAAGALILYLSCCCQEHECQSDLRLLRKMAPCTRSRLHARLHLHAHVHVRGHVHAHGLRCLNILLHAPVHIGIDARGCTHTNVHACLLARVPARSKIAPESTEELRGTLKSFEQIPKARKRSRKSRMTPDKA